ncbi:Protein STU1 [Hypsizygus marmoreus]|uniref:Protein STU1 n=1 Tax=Hypsizygus marmoreus TaxID=39966 RepID=A0A369JM40_HYPMA|nr:Protein STU1 [Hypsizygus marmoreus]
MASDDSRLERLISQCKSNDVDVKVDALTKLQVEFESGIEIDDPDGLLNVLKTCLRTSNQHLTSATLAALPPVLPLLISRAVNHAQSPSAQPRSPSSSTSSLNPGGIVDAATLRQVLVAFLPTGGVIDRLGDKEKAQLKARETLVVLGGLAFRTGGGSGMSSKSRDKGPETPLMMFERFLREGGLTSKVWKVREQSVLTLVHIRRAHHQFPIRPYLTLLVDCLEDTDAHVRECTRQAVVELFSGPGVTDGARADLKKEMTKKGVRKTIVDEVLSKLFSSSSNINLQSHEGSENGDANSKPKDYIPPSLALQGRRPIVGNQSGGIPRTASQGSVRDISRPSSRAAMSAAAVPPTPTNETIEIQPVYIASTKDLENEFAAMAKPFEGKETEHNWAAREQAILRVRGMLKGDVQTRYTDTFLACLKEGFIVWSLKALASLRTTVSANTASLYSELASALGPAIDPFCDTLLTNLLKMAGFTKKIAAQQSQASVTSIITHTSAQPRTVLPLLWNALQEKTVQARAFVVRHLKHYIEVHGHRSRNAIEGSGGLETLEKSLKKALSDANPAVKESARILFWTFEEVWQDRGLAILETLDPIARKQVEKVCPRPELIATLAPTTPKNTKKSSVAAAIAASRAKAKAIATAPPTLRHQATSGSHMAPVRRAGSPGAPSRASATRPASPLRISSSPPALTARSRTTSGGAARSTSTPGASLSHARTPSGGSSGSGQAVSPPSSPVEQPTFRRRTSSPLATTTSITRPSTIRKALQTSLPPSPPLSTGQVSPTPRGANGGSRNTPVPLPARHSRLSLQLTNGQDESLLLAQAVPLPDNDSDSDDGRSVNLMSFSAPFEMYPPITPKAKSAAQSFSPKYDSKPTAGVSNALSSDSIGDMAVSQVVVEDALRARAEQAESAAERLLELVEPEDEGLQHSTIPASLLVGSGNGHAMSKPKTKPTPIPITQGHLAPPVTPVNRTAAIMRQAAMFKDSPAHNGHAPSLIDVLQGKKHETGWWLKRKTLVAQGTPLRATQPADIVQELQSYITALKDGDPGIRVLQKLALLCIENPVVESSSPPPSPGFGFPSSPSPFFSPSRSLPSLQADLWDTNKNFDRLFNALVQFLDYTRSEEEIEYGLIVLWEMLENQRHYLDGKESDLFSVLLRVRYTNKLNVLEASSTIRDALTASIEPVYGITTMHASLRTFYAEPYPPTSDEDIKAATYAFGLIALGKFILRLPAEIAEEELPRLKGTLISSLNDRSSLIVRESAAACIIAAQLVLRDETHLFALLDGLADDKKNLLTYLFDKHGARGLAASAGSSGMDKLQKEISRLDTRTSTPSRATPVAVAPLPALSL